MPSKPQIPWPTSTVSTKERDKYAFPPRAENQDVSLRVMIHYPEDSYIPKSIWEAREMFHHYPDDEPIASTHRVRDTESVWGILKPARPVESALGFPAVSLPPHPPYNNPRKRSRESIEEDDGGHHCHEQASPSPRPSTRPRLVTYALTASRINALGSYFTEVELAVRVDRKRSHNALEDSTDPERLLRRPPPPVFSGFQVLNGRICADTVGEIDTERKTTLRFAPIASLSEIMFLVGTQFAKPLSKIAQDKADEKAAETARLADPRLQAKYMHEKWKKLFSWMVNRQVAKVKADRDELLGRRLALAHTPAEVRVAEREMEDYEKSFRARVYLPKKAEAVAITKQTIALLWAREPVLVLGSAPTAAPELPPQEDTPMMEASALEPYEEPPFEPMPNAPPPSPERYGSDNAEPAAPVEHPENAIAGPSSRASAVSNTVIPKPLPPSSEPPAAEDPPQAVIVPRAVVLPPKPPMSLRSGRQVACRVVYHPRPARQSRRKAKATS